ncbi:uncharacterized protein LOC143882940 [Tasmannia lanceolata]|uniref:uncharacterized protein LOC143882940 n=1 Tax=Tasmannia lanceolata TaxID=3420 RepID=UPI0040637938
MTIFLVVDVPFTYSAIIRQPALRDLGAMVSTPHLQMKFLTSKGVGEIHGQQMVAPQCYDTSLKGSNAPLENFEIESTIRTQLVDFLKANENVLAWSTFDMPGISPEVAVHKLNVDPTHKPIRQKKWNFTKEQQAHMKVEVDKLLQAGFIRAIQYREWLANVVMVKKANGSWRACIDFSDLNRAYPKDPYPLPYV